MNNLNTTIDKVAMSEFNMHYYQLGDNEKQWCHDEMISNKKWLKKDFEDTEFYKSNLHLKYKTYE
jgi:hypothetical protein